MKKYPNLHKYFNGTTTSAFNVLFDVLPIDLVLY